MESNQGAIVNFIAMYQNTLVDLQYGDPVFFILLVFFVFSSFFHDIYVILCAISYHLHNFKNEENTHGGVLLLVNCWL